jgi:hypothetical protein
MSAAAVVIVEGPHDRTALHALMDKLADEEGVPALSAHGIALIDAGAADASGGAGAVTRIAHAARELGFRTIAVLDHDSADQADAELAAAQAAADVVIRLPEGFAIERALADGLDDDALVEALRVLGEGFGIRLPDGFEESEGTALRRLVVKLLKQSGGLHAEFVAALGEGDVPPTARKLLEQAIAAGVSRERGLFQLGVD